MRRNTTMPVSKAAPVIIKKYGNRRLYDTSDSRYVNLDDIAGLVRNGKDVQVIDARTGEDLTRVILTQIILEDAKGQSSGLPLEMLRQLVVATDRVGRDFLMSYLKSAFDAYHKVQTSVHSTLAEVQAAALSPIRTVRSFVQGPSSRPDASLELGRLRQRVAELEARVKSSHKKPARKQRRQKSAGASAPRSTRPK